MSTPFTTARRDCSSTHLMWSSSGVWLSNTMTRSRDSRALKDLQAIPGASLPARSHNTEVPQPGGSKTREHQIFPRSLGPSSAQWISCSSTVPIPVAAPPDQGCRPLRAGRSGTAVNDNCHRTAPITSWILQFVLQASDRLPGPAPLAAPGARVVARNRARTQPGIEKMTMAFQRRFTTRNRFF